MLNVQHIFVQTRRAVTRAATGVLSNKLNVKCGQNTTGQFDRHVDTKPALIAFFLDLSQTPQCLCTSGERSCKLSKNVAVFFVKQWTSSRIGVLSIKVRSTPQQI